MEMSIVIIKAIVFIISIVAFVISGERIFRKRHSDSGTALAISGLWVVICGALSVFALVEMFKDSEETGNTVPSAPMNLKPIQWKLARGDRNTLGYGLVAQDPRTDVVFSVYCNRSFDEGGWNVALRFPETPAGRDSFKRITGSFQPLYGTYRTFEFDIWPNFKLAMPLQISPNTRQRVQMVFRSEPPGAGGREQFAIPSLLINGNKLSRISFEDFELLGEVSANGFAKLIKREAISDDCSLDKLQNIEP